MSDPHERRPYSPERSDESPAGTNDSKARSAESHVASGKCLAIAERLSEYIDGELPADLKAQVEAHNAQCANCEKFVESLRRTKELAHLMRHHELPASTLERLAEQARKRLGL